MKTSSLIQEDAQVWNKNIKGQPANPGLPAKWLSNWCVCMQVWCIADSGYGTNDAIFVIRQIQGRHTRPQPFYGPFSGTTQVSRCQKRTSRLFGARGD